MHVCGVDVWRRLSLPLIGGVGCVAQATVQSEKTAGIVRVKRRHYAVAQSEWQTVVAELGRARLAHSSIQGSEPGSPAARRSEIKASRLEQIVGELAAKVDTAAEELRCAEVASEKAEACRTRLLAAVR